jgi:hypothetical protein
METTHEVWEALAKFFLSILIAGSITAVLGTIAALIGPRQVKALQQKQRAAQK